MEGTTMLLQAPLDPSQLAWLGAGILLIGEIIALLSIHNLKRLIIVSTLAEVGYILLGIGIGGPAGETGAYMSMRR